MALILATLLALTAASAQAPAAAPAPSDKPQAPVVEGDPNKRVCRSVMILGSRIPERVCRTRAEWAQIERESQEAMTDNRRNVGASGDPLQ